jgi:hypothetical protein
MDDLATIFGKPTVAKEGAPPPKQPLREIFSDSLGDKDLASLVGREPGVDYSKGAPVGIRYNLSRAQDEDQEKRLLTSRYGAQGFRKDPGGNYLVKEKEGWVPVYPAGVLESMKSGAARTAAVAPQLAGGALGAVGGTAVGGPVGGVAGAVLGAGAARGADEGVKSLQGFGPQSLGELGWSMGKEGAIAGAFQGAGPAAAVVKKPMFNAASKAFETFGAITPESRAIAQSLERFGVTPPLKTLAPGLPALEYDRQLRNMVAKDPKLAGRIAAIDQRTKEVLEAAGFQGKELANAVMAVQDKTSALSGTQATEGVRGALQSRETSAAQAAKLGEETAARAKTALTQEEMANRDLAQNAIQAAYESVNRTARQPVGSLGSNVARVFEHERQIFTDQMRQAYGAVHQMAGGADVVPTRAFSQMARDLVATMDPQAVPPIIRRYAGEPGEGGGMISIEEAHNLRTALREMSKIKDLSPIGQRSGNLRQMAASVDDAIVEAGEHAGGPVAAALREADEAYGQGIQRFTNHEVNSLVQDVRNGRMPEPQRVADMLLDKNSMDATRQIWNMLPPQLQSDVIRADMRNIVDSASATGKDGRRTLNPDALLKMMDEKEKYDFIYPRPFIQHMRDLALDAKALDGSVDVTALPPNQTREYIERAVGARKALEENVQKNPLQARQALSSDDPELIKTGARFFIAPGNEARTLAGMQVVGPGSPEWKEVQKFAVQDLLKQAVVPKGLSRTVSGNAIEDYLAKLTPTQQKVLYGDQLPDIKLIAQQAKALFPELEDSMGGSLAAAGIKGHLLTKTSAIRAYTMSRFFGAVADSPALAKMLAGQLRAQPAKGRYILSYLMQEEADVQMNRPQQMAVTPQSELSGAFSTFGGGATPKVPPVAQAPEKRGFGGPME